jgi:hypothetical protein
MSINGNYTCDRLSIANGNYTADCLSIGDYVEWEIAKDDDSQQSQNQQTQSQRVGAQGLNVAPEVFPNMSVDQFSAMFGSLGVGENFTVVAVEKGTRCADHSRK